MSPKHDTNWPSKDINLNWPPCVLLLIMITLKHVTPALYLILQPYEAW